MNKYVCVYTNKYSIKYKTSHTHKIERCAARHAGKRTKWVRCRWNSLSRTLASQMSIDKRAIREMMCSNEDVMMMAAAAAATAVVSFIVQVFLSRANESQYSSRIGDKGGPSHSFIHSLNFYCCCFFPLCSASLCHAVLPVKARAGASAHSLTSFQRISPHFIASFTKK